MSRTQVPNVELKSDTARANLLTNGGFEIWQRGNGPFTISATLSADRWNLSVAGGDTLSVSRDTTNMDVPSAACAAVAYTRVGGGSNIYQYLNVADGSVQQLRGKTISFSARVRANAANAIRLRLNDNVGGVGGASYSSYHSGGGGYETLSVSFTVTATATNCNAMFDLAASCTAYIDNAMLVVGSVPADYAPLHPADDLARCLRYYELVATASGGEFVIGGAAGTTGVNVYQPFFYRVPKAITPTVTRVGTWSVTSCSQPSTGSASILGVQVYVNVTASGQFLAMNSNAGNTITIEANP